MKKLLWYIPLIGIYFTIKAIRNKEIKADSIHFLGTAFVHSLIDTLIILDLILPIK